MELAVLHSFSKYQSANLYIDTIKEYYSQKDSSCRISCYNAETLQNPRLMGTQLFLLLAETKGVIGAPLSKKISEILKDSVKPPRYRAVAFVKHSAPFWKNKALLNAMKILEEEGMNVVYSDHLSSKSSLLTSLGSFVVK